MRKFGLIGFPLGHSFSQPYFQKKFQREGITDCLYENFPLPDIGLLPGLLLREPQLEGLNVTIPHKEKVISILDFRDPVVESVGACNCLLIRDGKCQGYNTDVTGFETSLKRRWHPAHAPALILGTGGAAKAVAFVLGRMGISYHFVSRNPGPGVMTYADLTEETIRKYRLIINASPAGMYPRLDSYPPLAYGALSGEYFLFDLVYNPAETIFLQKGREQGCVIQNGAEMLQIQAEESWSIWNRR